MSPQAYSQAKAEQARRFQNRITPRYYDGDDTVEFINREMVIPETGKPLILHDEQAAVLRAMSHRTNGNYDYSMWLYSAPKKSGKTTVAAAIALWQAIQVPDGQVYIIGNDQRQADNRMMEAIRYAIGHNPRFKNRVRIIRNTIYMDNGTKLESIPVDPKGEAGMNPTGLFWTEAWGAMGNKPELLWSEAVLSPTRAGKSFKLVESYAGFEGESLILERLYKSIIKGGKPYEGTPELYTKGESIGYWCTRRYMDWQVKNPQYYVNEENEKTPQEFNRIHNNVWASATQAFVPNEWIRACQSEYSLNAGEGVIVGVDAATSSDCFAVVAVSRRGNDIFVHYSRVWYPPKGGTIDFREPEAELKRLIREYNVLEISFDAYQIYDLMERLRSEEFVNTRSFPQGGDRLLSDMRLYTLIRERKLHHHGDADLVQHISNADADISKEENKMRIVKRSQDLKIDAAVALAMAAHRSFVFAMD